MSDAGVGVAAGDAAGRLRAKIADHAREADEGWGPAYGHFARLIEARRLSSGAEIGVAFGGHAESLLTLSRIEKLYGVDPFRHMDDYDDPFNIPQEEFDEVFRFTIERLSRFGARYEHVRETSEHAATLVGTVNFVYIDADHSYHGVWNDLCAWFPKVTDGGLVGGHDYGHPDFPTVRGAVDEFLRRLGLHPKSEGAGVWWVEKPALTRRQFAVQQSLRPLSKGHPTARPILSRLRSRLARVLQTRVGTTQLSRSGRPR